MNIDELKVDGYERVIHFFDDNFSAYIAIHNIRLGIALGGCRVKSYLSDASALQDALDLSKGMSYKNSLAGLNYGGGKCVVNAPEATGDIMHKVGKAIEYLKGQYITAEDVGTNEVAIAIAATETSYVASLGAAGDPSPWTALGVFASMHSVLEHFELWEDPNLAIWIEGLGKVGWALAEYLYDRTIPNLYVSDIVLEREDEAVKKFEATSAVMDKPGFVDLYAPCALGQSITTYKILAGLPKIICGSANNQLEDDNLADFLKSSGITYCPDFLVNAGGVIALAGEIDGFDGFDYYKVEKDVFGIGQRLKDVLQTAEHQQTTPLAVAKSLAESRW